MMSRALVTRFPIRSGALWTGRGFGLGRDQQSFPEAPQYHTLEKEGKVSTRTFRELLIEGILRKLKK